MRAMKPWGPRHDPRHALARIFLPFSIATTARNPLRVAPGELTVDLGLEETVRPSGEFAVNSGPEIAVQPGGIPS